MEQRTAQWFAARCGCLTASRAADVLERLKRGGVTTAWQKYADELLCERITGKCTEHFKSSAMEWGEIQEPFARDEYEIATGNFVTETGFVRHPTVPWLGASPDGLVGDDGLLEIKCPNTVTHLRRVKEGVVPDEYKPQMLVQLLCTGRKWVDFVDFDPRLVGPWEKARLFIVRFEPTQEELEDALDKCKEFLAHVESELDELRGAIL